MEINIDSLKHEKYCRLIEYIENSQLDERDYTCDEGTGSTSNRSQILRIKSIGSVNGHTPTYQDIVIQILRPYLRVREGEMPNKEDSDRINSKTSQKVQGLVRLLLEEF